MSSPSPSSSTSGSSGDRNVPSSSEAPGQLEIFSTIENNVVEEGERVQFRVRYALGPGQVTYDTDLNVSGTLWFTHDQKKEIDLHSNPDSYYIVWSLFSRETGTSIIPDTIFDQFAIAGPEMNLQMGYLDLFWEGAIRDDHEGSLEGYHVEFSMYRAGVLLAKGATETFEVYGITSDSESGSDSE